MAKITPDQLEEEIGGMLDNFYLASISDIQEAAKAAGKQAVKDLKNTSPGRQKKYARGWKMKAENTRTGANVTIYNDGYYMLAHLLEYGHPKTNGGRVPGQVHIQPVEASAMNQFEKEVRRRVESGT